jgi:hypothetical protein
LADVGIRVPAPNEWNDDALHLVELDRRRTEEGYLQLHPLVRQAYHEHAQMHVQRMEKRLGALRPQPADPNAADNMLSAMQQQLAAEQQPGTGTAAQQPAPATPAAGGGGAPSDNSVPPPPAEPELTPGFEMPPDQFEMEPAESEAGMTTFTSPPDWTMKAPEIHVNFPQGAINVSPPEVTVEPVINVAPPVIPPVPPMQPPPQPDIQVNVPAPEVTVSVEKGDGPDSVELESVEYDEKGRIKNARFRRVDKED